MCQLNVYVIKNELSRVEVKSIVKNNGFYAFEDMTNEVAMDEYKDEYSFYNTANMRCDCASFVCSLQNEAKNFDSYSDFCKDSWKLELTKLYKIKDLLEKTNYKEILENFKKQVHEFLQSEPTPKEIEDFFEENLYITQSSLYNLNKPTREQLNSALGTVYIGGSIYAQIEKHEKEMNEIDGDPRVFEEYKNMLKLIDDILNKTNEFKIFAFWQDGDAIIAKEYKTIKRQDVKIEDFLFLPYNSILTIVKR